ncbi:hypothetical protein FG386_003091 [Cryptosporidium ryanae]|uniref:uncharacterized protein n=1 Tax=Cryptosporidium ryanae TaxID=515981 RepID=UPI00351A0921|nr:hypothetical protein FG386_003091 [Cryptosporidium ryanae]
MVLLESLSQNEKIQSKFENVLIKKEAGNLYITSEYFIWISKSLSKKFFEDVKSIKECYSNYIEMGTCYNANNNNLLFTIEQWESLYAHRKRVDKKLVGLRFEKKKNFNNRIGIEYVDINLTFNNDGDFNIFTEAIVGYRNSALDRAKKRRKEVLTEKNKNEELHREKIILADKKVKEVHKKTIYEELNQLLKYRPELEQVYESVVLTGNMSLESFMKLHKSDTLLSYSQEKGVSNSDYFLKKPPKYSFTNNGNIDVTITADDLRSILEEMPLIKLKMNEYVPHRLTEEEFWNRVIHSPLFFNFLGFKDKTNNTDTLSIGDIPKGEELLNELYLNKKNLSGDNINDKLDNYVDKDINLLNNDRFYYNKKGYGTLIDNDLNISSEKSSNVNAGFFERFNFHGARILDLTTGSNYKTNKEIEKDMDFQYSQNNTNIGDINLIINNNNSSIQELDIVPEEFFSKSKFTDSNLNKNIEIKTREKDCNNILNINKNKINMNLFSNEMSKKILMISTKQVQNEQINQLNYSNKNNVIESKNTNELFLFDSICKDEDEKNIQGKNNNEVNIANNNSVTPCKEEQPVWMTQVKSEHSQAMELLRFFWGLSLSQKDNDERKKIIEALDKITHNIEFLVHDNTSLSASKISTYGQSTNKIKAMCLPILDSIKSARTFHYKLDELINNLNKSN